jgi:diguanylate cyclase (GGDEF)-like protein
MGKDAVRFFAATPARSDTGVSIGTLCVFDQARIDLDEEWLGLLDDLAKHVREHLHLHSQVQTLGHAATHDVLTGLCNRALLSDRLAHAMSRRGRNPGEPALALVDLDRFKRINDTLGHRAGDTVLVEIARRIAGAVRNEDTVARLGGDEFVVLYDSFPAGARGDSVERVLCSRLHACFADPVLIGETRLAVTGSIGFVRARPDELGYALLGRADEAMYQSRTDGRPEP